MAVGSGAVPPPGPGTMEGGLTAERGAGAGLEEATGGGSMKVGAQWERRQPSLSRTFPNSEASKGFTLCLAIPERLDKKDYFISMLFFFSILVLIGHGRREDV